ncbi:hypothetical protein [Spirosoma aerophilum]
MAKRSLHWLKDFKSAYKPSRSFLTCLNNALHKEYTDITGREFDILYLFAERPSDLIYLPGEYTAVLKASIEVQTRNYWGECLIGWRPKAMDKLVKPEDDIAENEVEFKWIELSLPNIASQPPATLNMGERLNLSLDYQLIIENGIDSQDVEFYLQLNDSAIVKSLESELATLQANWNEQADQDTTRQTGYIHWLSFEREEDGEYVFRMDTGSAGVEGLKRMLGAFNDPKWGIKKVELFYL